MPVGQGFDMRDELFLAVADDNDTFGDTSTPTRKDGTLKQGLSQERRQGFEAINRAFPQALATTGR